MRGLLLLITTLASCLAAEDCLFTAVDLTQELAPSTNYYPDFYPFEVSLENAISETFANASKYVAGDEGGTKVEVPARFREDGYTIGKLFKDRLLFLKACIIDLAEKTAMNDNYQASVQDVEEWQYIFGAFPSRSIVIFDFGWSARYPDGDRYFGKRDTLNHPGISPELADYIGRHGSVVAVGTDAPDVDCGRNNELSTSPSQRVLAAHNKYTVTQLALGRHRLPAVGALVTVAPFYMADASAAPARVFAEFCADPEPEVVDPNPPPPPQPAPPQIQYVYVAVPTPAPTPAATQTAQPGQKQVAPTGTVASERAQSQPASSVSYATTSFSPSSSTSNSKQPYTVVSSPTSSGGQEYATKAAAASSSAPSQTYQYVLSQPPSGSQDNTKSPAPASTYGPSSSPAYNTASTPASKPTSSSASSSPSLTAAQYLQLAAALAQQEQQQATPGSPPSAVSQYLNLLASQLNSPSPSPSPTPPPSRHHVTPPSPHHEHALPPAPRPSQPRPHMPSPNLVPHDHAPSVHGSAHNNRLGHPRPKQASHHR